MRKPRGEMIGSNLYSGASGVVLFSNTGGGAAPPYSYAAVEISGPTIVAAGALALTGIGALVISGPTLTAVSTLALTSTGTLVIGGPALVGVGNAAGLTTGAVEISGPTITAVSTLALVSAGALEISGPTLAAVSTLSLTSTGALEVSGPTLVGVGALASASTGALVIGGPTLAAAGTINLTSTGALVISGPGLAGASTLALIAAGALEVGGPKLVASGTAGGATNPLATIGVLTLPNAGERYVAGAADGTYLTYWVVSSERLKRNGVVGTPTPGTFSAGGTEITVKPDEFDVISKTEFEAVLALGSAVIGGKTICGIGEFGGTNNGDRVTFSSSLDLTNPLTVTSRDMDTPASLRRLLINAAGHIVLDGLVIEDRWVLWDATTNVVFRYIPPSAAAGSLTIRRCIGRASDVTKADTKPPTITTVTTGYLYQVMSVTSPDWTAIGGPAVAAVGNSFHATVDSADITAYGSVRKHPEVLYWYQDNIGTVSNKKVTFEDNYIHTSVYGVVSRAGDVVFRRNRVAKTLADNIRFDVQDASFKYLIEDNVFGNCILADDNSWGYHVDTMQVNLESMNGPNTAEWIFRGNRTWEEQADVGQQGSFVADPPPELWSVKMLVQDNIFHTSQRNGITLSAGGAGSRVERNTLLFDLHRTDFGGGLSPHIIVGQEQGGVVVRDNLIYNITSGPLTAAKSVNNLVFPSEDDAGMATYLTGTNSRGNSYATLDEWTAAMMPKAGTEADRPYGMKVGAGWNYSWTGPVPQYSKSGLPSGVSTVPAPIVPDFFKDTDWELVDVGSNQGLHGHVITLPLDGGEQITDVEYRVDGGAPVSTGGVKQIPIPMSELTSGVPASVEIRPVNSVGPGAWSLPKVKTPTASYVVNAVVMNDGQTLDLASGLGIPTSQKGILQSNIFFASSVPGTSRHFMLQKASGQDRIGLKHTSGGGMNFTLAQEDGTSIVSASSAGSTFVLNEWYTLAASWDTTTGVRTLRVKLLRKSTNVWSDLITNTNLPADAVIGSLGAYTMKASINTTQYRADHIAIIGAYLDLNVPANLALFHPSVNQSGLITAAGITPQVQHTGPTAIWHVNKGTGPNPVLTNGPLDTAPSTPTS